MYSRHAAVVAAVALLVTAAAVAAAESSSRPSSDTEPLVVVENFLTARVAGDPWGATGWCAPLLELQDVDGQWFVDAPTTSDWLRQLTGKYVVDVMSPPRADGNSVTWTERLTPSSMRFSESLASRITIEVHAVIRDNTIAYLSGQYPPIPLRRPGQTPDEPRSSAGSASQASVAPATLFVGSALGLALGVLLVVRCGPAVRAVVGKPSVRADDGSERPRSA
jgi:hypothetical protein